MCRNHHTWVYSHYRQLDTQEQKCAHLSQVIHTPGTSAPIWSKDFALQANWLHVHSTSSTLPIILKLNSSPPIVPTPVLCSVLKYFKMKCGGSRGTREMRCTNCKMLIEKTNREALTPKIVNFMDTVYLYTNTCRISGHFEPKKYVAFVF